MPQGGRYPRSSGLRWKRRFVASRPNELWLADITYVSTWDGWLYVAFVLDVYIRAIVGWQIAGQGRFLVSQRQP